MSRRADRLFQIVQILRGRRLTTAAQLAERLEVSERTIYRDVRDLSLSGVPVEGEAGCGYRLLAGYDLPPLMLTAAEVEAAVAALRMVQTWSGEALAKSAESVHEKLMAILTPEKRRVAEQSRIISPDFNKFPQVKIWFDLLHTAIGELKVVHLSYENEKGELSERDIHPLGLSFWGEIWIVVAWCEARDDYRSFRLDRCRDMRLTERRYQARHDRSLQDFISLQKRKGMPVLSKEKPVC